MAPKKSSSSLRNQLTYILSLIILVIVILGAFGIIDTYAWDNALEPILGMRPFMTEPGMAAVTPVVESSASGDWWSVYFTTPGVEQNYVAQELIARINAAQSSIHIASFEFNLDEVAEALIAAHQRGVEIQ